ncbi:hypothetical protein AOZ06_25530 [Kibdelosporangium phytohabitans]|uniref:histidine kinase n=2 Tax=Kibdelosporangium phytohabitans TaxID=860235 RepID=A0A0N9I5V2_9PSEU|nr:hypothetical protein AOZ06_25530 [Kibdelosporangium phytohabitans]
MLLALALRWLAFGWMLIVALVSGQIQRPVEASVALLATGCWTAWLTLAAVRRTRLVLAMDVAVAIALTVLYGYVFSPHAMLTNHPSFMGAYPAAAVAACGVVYRVRGGCAAGLILGLSLPFAYAANEIALDELSFLQVMTMIGSGLSYVLLGGTIGAAARQLDALHERATRDGERAARMAERQRIAAQIHDDVLQQLGRLRGSIREMSAGPVLDAVAEGIARQESALRGLGSAEPDPPPPGVVSLRSHLAQLAQRYTGVPVRLVTAGPFPLPTGMATEIVAAVAELLTNVVKHAQANQVWLTVLPDGGDITVTVRDNGVGFRTDQDTDGLGLRLSVRARVHRMAGSVRIRSSPGHGTEVQLRVPKGNGHA